ncbi:MAG: hypothetical protein AB7U29_07675 [Desulfobulbus sp.]
MDKTVFGQTRHAVFVLYCENGSFIVLAAFGKSDKVFSQKTSFKRTPPFADVATEGAFGGGCPPIGRLTGSGIGKHYTFLGNHKSTKTQGKQEFSLPELAFDFLFAFQLCDIKV